jgi:hypothetical protein
LYGFFFAYGLPKLDILQRKLQFAGYRIFAGVNEEGRSVVLSAREYFAKIAEDTNLNLLTIAEHSGISVDTLTYSITTLELFSIWSSIIRKIEMQNEAMEKQSAK